MRARPSRSPASAVPAAVAALGIAALLAGCGTGSGSATSSSSGSAASSGSSDGPLKVVASTDVWGDIAKTVGGDDVEVTSFISDPSQDPHSYEASSRNQLVISDADVVIENGGGYDDFMDRMIKASKTKAPVVNAVETSGFTASDGGELNEHVWYDMPTVGKVADQIAAALGKADPGSADTFSANADALGKKLDTIKASEASVAKTAQGTGIAITEPVPLYMTTACGLTNDTPPEFSEAVEEGTDVSPAVLADTEALFSDQKVKALVYNEQTTGPETEAVLKAAKDGAVAVVPVTETLPDGKDFVGWMTDNVTAIGAAVAP